MPTTCGIFVNDFQKEEDCVGRLLPFLLSCKLSVQLGPYRWASYRSMPFDTGSHFRKCVVDLEKKSLYRPATPARYNTDNHMLILNLIWHRTTHSDPNSKSYQVVACGLCRDAHSPSVFPADVLPVRTYMCVCMLSLIHIWRCRRR